MLHSHCEHGPNLPSTPTGIEPTPPVLDTGVLGRRPSRSLLYYRLEMEIQRLRSRLS